MKKLSLVLIITVLFSFVAMQPCFAIQDLGDFTYWYSDSSSIGYYSSNIIKVYQCKTANFGMADQTFSNAVNTGFNNWASTTNFSKSTGTSSDYNWRAFGVSRAEGNSLGFPSDVNAATALETTSLTAIGHYSGAQKNVYSITKTTTYYVWDTSTAYKTSDFLAGKWNAISAHEFGHACGYYGHDSGSSSTNKALMNYSSSYYYDTWGVSSPQMRDINHMSSMY